MSGFQPLLHGETVILRAPMQAWSASDGSMGGKPIHGVYLSDTRLISGLRLEVDGDPGETIASSTSGADTVTIVSLHRALDDASADPRLRLVRRRTISTSGARESLRFESTLTTAVTTTVTLRVTSDLAHMDAVKAGVESAAVRISLDPAVAAGTDAREAAMASARWGNDVVTVTLRSSDAEMREASDGALELSWEITVPAKGSAEAGWNITATDAGAIVRGASGAPRWSRPVVDAGDERLERWIAQALADLDALRMSTVSDPGSEFLAAGAPWFFTLFGRDSIWAARFMLPLGTRLAGDTLRVLASLQGTDSVPDTAEQPGKIMHELRRGEVSIPSEGVSLPPLYFGTVDATALWVCLLHDAWKWGLPDEEVRALLPNLVSALRWMRDYGDSDGDGLLEYIDESGRGLANQGWKDSGDSVQWRDGTLAEGPIALCEVQAYAYEAATHGAELLDHFGVDGGQEWRDWASVLHRRFHETFWIRDEAGDYPAIALDRDKRPVDTVTSNLGHLLGTGLLSGEQAALVARRLSAPEMNSGFGLRTMSTDSTGYWPLSYHGGSVWTHDTAIAIAGLAMEGFADEAAELTRGLLTAASGFGYRVPELHSGDRAHSNAVSDDADTFSEPVPYPAACTPQAWSAAASVSVLASSLGLRPDAQAGMLSIAPTATFGSLRLSGLRLGAREISVTVNSDGELSSASGATFEVR